MEIFELEKKIKEIIDDLKGLCQVNGLANQASEEVVITSVFLYKFLNDKFMHNLKDFAVEMDMSYEDVLSDKNMMDGFYDTYPQDVAFQYEDTIDYLVNYVSDNNFYKKFLVLRGLFSKFEIRANPTAYPIASFFIL